MALNLGSTLGEAWYKRILINGVAEVFWAPSNSYHIFDSFTLKVIHIVPALHVCLCGNHGLSGFSQVLKSQECSIHLKCLLRSWHLKPPKECAANPMLSACRFSQPANQRSFTPAHTHKSQAVIKEAGGGIILSQIIHSFSKGDKSAHIISRSGLFCSTQHWAYWQQSKTCSSLQFSIFTVTPALQSCAVSSS